MRTKLTHFLDKYWMFLFLAVMLPVYWNIALLNEQRVDYLNNGFFTFWLGGQMTWSAAHPYSAEDWLAGHHLNGATWIPNQIFPYPLPLTLFTAPLGLLPLKTAYILWDCIAQLLIGTSVLWLAARWEGLNKRLYALPLLAAVTLNGNIFLGLMTGTFAALLLAFLTVSLLCFEAQRPFWGGFALALLALKPPLLTIAILLGVWILLQRNWRGLLGGLAGGLTLLVLGLLQDRHWITKFMGAGNHLLSIRVGNQPTILSYTRLACAGEMTCAMTGYALAVLVLIALFIWVIWKNQARLTPLKAFSLAIPLGVLLPPYLWSYDYTLLVIPICYVTFELIRRRQNYLPATLFLILLDALALVGLLLFWMTPESSALTIQRDMWSIWVGLYLLAASWGLVLRAAPEADQPAPNARSGQPG